VFRNSLLKQRKPLAKKRLVPRRNEGRVKQERMKPKHTEPNAEQKRYWDSLVPYCVNCGKPDAVIHHIMEDCAGKEYRRDHWFVVRLCAKCHNMDKASVHLNGKRESGFKAIHNCDLVWLANRNLTGWKARQHG
jgi:hypothetical protein